MRQPIRFPVVEMSGSAHAGQRRFSHLPPQRRMEMSQHGGQELFLARIIVSQ